MKRLKRRIRLAVMRTLTRDETLARIRCASEVDEASFMRTLRDIDRLPTR